MIMAAAHHLLAETQVALVTELGDPNDVGRYSGLFAAHTDDPSGAESKMGPVDVPVEEAIAWGRAQAEVVLVQVGGGDDGEYSAGSREALDKRTRPWPPHGLKIAARPERSALDGSEQVVAWKIRAEAAVPPAVAEEVISVLAKNETVADAGAALESRNQIEFILQARGATPALKIGWRLFRSAVADVLGPKNLEGTWLHILDVARAVR